MKTRPGPWYPQSYSQWRLAVKRGFRRTRWHARLGWDDPIKQHSLPRSGAMAVLMLVGVLLAAGVIVSGSGAAVLVGCATASSLLFLGEVTHILPDAQKRRYEVIYQTAPCWRVGEDDRDRDLADPTRADMRDEDHYPEDYVGMVLAVKESPANWRPGDLTSPNRQVVGLDLTVTQANVLRSKQQKVDPVAYTLGTVTVEDRYGATLPGLVEKFGSVAGVETAGVEADALLQSGGVHPLQTESIRLKNALPKTIVHSGAGLYEVGPAKTYATFTLALAQLWIDQGSAAFTQIQYIRGFADTYNETIYPNTSLNPNETAGYPLVIEGDPNDVRTNIVAQASNFVVRLEPDMVLLRHMKIIGLGSAAPVVSLSTTTWARIIDCDLRAPSGRYGMHVAGKGTIIEDCNIVSYDHGVYSGGAFNYIVRRCTISQLGSSADYGVYQNQGHGIVVEGCTISNYSGGGVYTSHEWVGSSVRNNTIYNCVHGIFADNNGPVVSINNIFHTVTYPYRMDAWPDESGEGRIPSKWVLRNNCYKSGYTGLAFNGAATKTHAQFSAFDRVDEDGDLVDTDPLLTTPGSDYSLQVGSPCRHAGHGSGVIADYFGTSFDPNTPDIGGWSSGPIPALVDPSWAGDDAEVSATNQFEGDGVDVSFKKATITGGYDILYEIAHSIGGPFTVACEYTDDGSPTYTIPVDELTTGQPYMFRVRARRLDNGSSWITAGTGSTDTATPTWGDAPTWSGNDSNIAATDAGTGGDLLLTWDAATQTQGKSVGYIVESRTSSGPGAWVESFRTNALLGIASGLTDGVGYDIRVKAFTRDAGEATRIADDMDSATPTAPSPPTPSISVVSGLGILRRTPHTVTLKRPDVTRDNDNNVATRDYDNPILTKTVRCLFQTRGGEVSVGDEGNIVPFDAVFYTLDKDIQVNDRIEVDLYFHTGNFLVTAVVPKSRQIGIYSHNEIILQKDGVR